MGNFLYDLTAPQKSIWLTEQFGSNTSLNNIGGYVFIHDTVCFEALEKAIKLYVKRNTALNLRIKLTDGTPKQYLSDFEDFKIDIVELKDMQEVEAFNQKITNTPFEFFDSALYRFVMFKLPDGTGGFNPTLHHIISDAWNMSLLIDEIMEAYSHFLSEKVEDTTEFPSYLDYISNEQDYFASNRFQKDREFWNDMFQELPPLSYIVPDKKQDTTFEANRKMFELETSFQDKVTHFCEEHHCSLYTFFMAIYSLYLAKVNCTHTSIIGTPVLNRSNFKEKRTSGMFISTVPFKVNYTSECTFDAFLSQVAAQQLSIFRHQRYPYDTLLQDIKKEHHISDNLYDFVFSYQNARDDKSISDVNYTSHWLFTGHTLDTLEVHFYDLDDTGHLKLYYDYQTNKLSEIDIENIHARIIHMANTVIEHPDCLLQNISVTTPKEEAFLLNNFNTTTFGFDQNTSLVSLFEKQASSYPDKTACVFENTSLTYAQLNEKANQIAHFLMSHKAVVGHVVGIMLPRCLEVISCMLGVLKSGNGYLLIDPSLPKDRIAYMLENAKVSSLITTNGMSFDFANTLLLENILSSSSCDVQNPNIPSNPEDIFCVIYTSGSTGLPKGVSLKRLGVINMLYSYQHFLGTNDCDTFLSTSTVAFDMFIVENFVPLLSGKTVVLANEEEQKVPIFMATLIQKHNVHFILSTPSKISLLLLNADTKACLKNIKVLQLGGEVFGEHLYKELRSCTNARIFNGYGPSECTACCSNKEVIDEEDITIGRPFLNTHITLLNPDLNLLPIGYSGEICVSGLGVGHGYIYNEELTAKAFIKNPFGEGMLYKTGDMGKYTQNGDLIYLGRRDSQVKLRGLRIELDEITNKLLEIEGTSNAVCVIKKVNHTSCICAYVVKSDSHLQVESIKSHLAACLPHYMVPSHIVFLESLPITLNGKIDTKKLPEITLTEITYIAPKTKTEIALANLWCQILEMDSISLHMNFFDLGGDSLCAIKLVSEIYSKLNIKVSIKDIFTYPTLEGLANYIDTKKVETLAKVDIPKARVLDAYPLSSAQKRIYYTVQMEPNSVNYNTPGGLIFTQMPDVTKLEKCLNTLIARHSALRTYFEVTSDGPKQKVLDSSFISLEVVHSESKTIDEIFKEFLKPFDLSKAPLFRVCLHALSNDQYILLLDMHHIICDGESVAIFTTELCKLYRGEKLEELSLAYTDYAVWEQELATSDHYKRSESYWIKQFEEEIPVLNMPTTYPRPSVQSFEGAKVYGKIEHSSALFDLCKELNTTPYLFLLSVYYILLYKYTNQTDIVVGSPIVGRENANISRMLGMFVNTIALRTKISSNDSFKTFLQYVTANCFNAFEHQAYPFDELLKKLNITRDTSRNPLFDTMFIYQNNGMPEVSFGDLQATYYIPDNHTSKFDFSLEIIPEKDNFNLNLEYCTKLFSKEFMEAFLAHYIHILETVMQDTNISIAQIDMLLEIEKQTILSDFNKTTLDYPSNKTVIELFEEQVHMHPDHTALIYGQTSLSYRELNEKVLAFAHHLQKQGIRKQDYVCTLLPRSTDFIIALLAIMKCGAIYLPISTTFPIDRIQYIVENSKSKLVITHSSLEKIENIPSICIDQVDHTFVDPITDIQVSLLPEDVIYTIYTSGSTGNPKGVQITNQNLNHFIHSFKELFDQSVNSNDICLSTTSIAFDVSIWEFFFTLLNGATLCLYEHESIEDIFDFCHTLLNHNITMAYIPPNILDETYSVLHNYKEQVKLSKILLGVEPIKTNIVMKYFTLNPNMKIVNGYGPTETTICATAFKIENNSHVPSSIVPIGRPLHNMKAYVLDSDLMPLPTNVPGELYMSGDGVGHGYLNMPELTKQKYIASPFDIGKRMYKTGDVVKWLPDGNLMFVGRNDNQVKIKGHRIELGEIVNVISEYPTITKCVVLVKEENNNKSLACFFTATNKVVMNDLRSFLTLKLPFYSIPNFFTQLDKFVLTSNGKIDFKYLETLKLETVAAYELPRNDFEKKLSKLWKEFLKVDKVGINDNFFDLGGDSLIAIKLQIEAFKLGIDISYGDIFSFPTIKQLSNKASTPITKNMDIEDFYYQAINHLIAQNKLPLPSSFKKAPLKNVLLTGVTGFVGIHILDKLLTNTDATVYCLVRNKNNTSYISRLKKTLQFYFGNQYDDCIGTRIKVIEGDITQENFGLSDEICQKVGNDISCMINSAAIVKHYGKSPLFDDTNITGVKNVIHFATRFHLKLYHISTLSVSGNVFAEDSFSGAHVDTKITFKEDNLFAGQDLSNLYLYTKFMAERMILENVEKGSLNATILRLGNITSRFSDGKFQINASENAFLNRLLSFIKLKCIPDYLIEGYTEFTPVDCLANAIIQMIQYDFPYTILHLFNHNHISISNIIQYFNDYGLPLDVVDHDTFLQTVDMALQTDKNILSGIINDFDTNKKLVYDSNVKLNDDFTTEFLAKISFTWPEIDKEYIFKYLDYLKNIGYIEK